MSLFGASNTKPAAGLFGSTQPSQPPSGLFGGTNANTNQQPGSFGTLTLQQPQPQPQQQQQQPQATGGLFGGSQTQSSGLFGGGTTGGGGTPSTGTGSTIFGNTGANVGANPTGATTSGGLFGSTNTNTTFGVGGTGGGLFGNTSNTPGASNFFTQPPAGNTSSISGQQPHQQSQQQQQPSSLFGSLGQGQTTQAPSFGSFGLGQTQALTNTSGGSKLFSSNSLTTSMLSQPAPTNSLFGTKSSLQASSFLPRTQSSQPSDNSAQAQAVALQQRIEAIVAAWNPQSPQCRFQHYFYNLVDKNQVSMYGRPATATNDALWQQAVRENPDPSCMVPVLAIGFDDLQKRVDAQSKQAALHQGKLKELQARLDALAQTHLLSNTLRTSRALKTHTLITHRLLRLLEHIHLLIPALRSSAIGPEEEALRARLERLRDDVQRGVGGGDGRGRLNELWALLGAVQAARESAGRDSVEWKVVDQEGLERLALILSEQQQGLAHLTNIINSDMKDLQIIEEWGGIGESALPGSSPQRGRGASPSKPGLLHGH